MQRGDPSQELSQIIPVRNDIDGRPVESRRYVIDSHHEREERHVWDAMSVLVDER